MGRRKKQSENIESIKIKNYTSSIPIERTLMLIEKELLKIGINGIEKKYVNGIVNEVIFSVEIDNAKLSFKIPSDINAAEKFIEKIPEYKTKKREWIKQQAQRTAWKLTYDWICIEVARVQLNQVDAVQIFLPYMYNNKTGMTVYEKMKGNNFKLLEGSN